MCGLMFYPESLTGRSVPLRSRCAALTAALLFLMLFTAAPGAAEDVSSSSSQAHSKQKATYPKISAASFRKFKISSEPGFPGRIAFSAEVDGLNRIFVYDLDGGKISALVAGPGNSTEPTWSPDGTRLAFISDRDGGEPAIFITRWDGTNTVRISPDNQKVGNPAWHPKGNKIVYYAEESAGRSHTNIFSVHVPSSGSGRRIPRRITKLEGRNITPHVSPNGQIIAYSTNRFWPGWEICLWNLSTGNESCPLTGSESYFRPAWSRDGKQILFSYGHGNLVNISSLNLATKSITEITNSKGRDYDGLFAPDNSRIIFTSESRRDNFDLFALEIDEHLDKTEKMLNSPFSIRSISWTPVPFMKLEARRMKAREERK